MPFYEAWHLLGSRPERVLNPVESKYTPTDSCYYNGVMPQLRVPAYIISICQTLSDSGHACYVVGGALRDTLLNRPIYDYDLASSALPEELIALFEQCIETGKAFGTVTVCIKEHGIMHTCEITSFRKEDTYSDSRHPDKVTFGATIEEDLTRRDFSINAMAYNPLNDQLLDPLHGKKALAQSLISAIGDPNKRFTEDSLRLFRACRFSACLGFEIDEVTWRSMCDLAPLLPLPALERVHCEMSKLLNAERCSIGLKYMSDCGLLDLSFGIRLSETDIHTIRTLEPRVRWAKLLSLSEDPKACLDSHPFSRADKRMIKRLWERNFDYEKASFDVKDLALSGKDLQAMGFQGVEIGEKQRLLLEAVLSTQLDNEKDSLDSFLRS
jgi:tRNA nucleotidyltransferase/poly(A) polymerase